MFKLDLEKAEEPEIKFPTSIRSLKKQENSRKTFISTLLNTPKPLTVDIVKEMGIPDHFTCLLRNRYAGHKATVRTGHRTTDWFQTRKGVRQGCILPPCLFNLYAEYIMLRHIDMPKNNSALNTSRHILNFGLYNTTYTS